MMSPFSNGKDKDNNQSFNQKYSIGQCLSFCCCIVLVILTSWAIIYVITLHLDMVAIKREADRELNECKDELLICHRKYK
uniref:Uncharacterized protein n=1 Tax=Ditylenchus dipsaci TaxID=166011 RepID=A0A915CPN2_9BILA